jgi:hypothetical protein
MSPPPVSQSQARGIHRTVRDELRIIPEPPKTWKGRWKAFLCRILDHSWFKFHDRATSWVTTVEGYQCRRCGEEFLREMLHHY